MKNTFKNTKKSIKEFGEVFTPTWLVCDILDKLPVSLFQENKTFLDNSCGNGQFLIEVLTRKLQHGFTHEKALSQIFGIELNPKNVEECKTKLLLGSRNPELIAIINHNIICADSLDPTHRGWDEVGFMWSV
jgi:type I restriction-modification system DNA methylase subunit